MIRQALAAWLVDDLAFSRHPRGKVWLGRLAGRWLDGTPLRSVQRALAQRRLVVKIEMGRAVRPACWRGWRGCSRSGWCGA